MSTVTMKEFENDFYIFASITKRIYQNYEVGKKFFMHPDCQIFFDVASMLFEEINAVFINSYILEVCKLFDRMEMYKEKNICFELIHHHLEKNNYNSLPFQELHNKMKIYESKLRPARNKIISHNDLKALRNKIVLGETTIEELDQFINDLKKYSSMVSEITGFKPEIYEDFLLDTEIKELFEFLKNNYNSQKYPR